MVQRQIEGIPAGMTKFQWLGITDLESETSTDDPLGPLHGTVEGRHIEIVTVRDTALLGMTVAAEAAAKVGVDPEAAANVGLDVLTTVKKAVRS